MMTAKRRNTRKEGETTVRTHCVRMFSRLALGGALLVAIIFAMPAGAIASSTPEQLTNLTVTEPFDGSSTSLERFEADWATLGWAGGGTPKGADTTSGWRAVDPYSSAPNGAYYDPSLADAGAGAAAVATMAANPGISERYFSLWLDMPSPGGARAGYELHFTETASNTYEVELSKWQSGSQTVLATETGYTFENGDSFAIADQGVTVSAWTDTGSGFEALLAAEDSAFSEGNAGVEAKGNITRLTDFKAGSLGDPTPEQLTNLTVTEPFDGSSASLERFETGWSTLGWAGGNTPKGSDTTSGWRAVDPYSSAPNGAYYDPSLADAGAGAAAVATMAANPGISERYFSLWLDMPSPGGTRAGYELRFTETASNTYEVELSKWQSGSQTVLATETGYTFENGDSFAIADQGVTVSAWTDTGSGFEALLAAEDSAFSEGNAGVEAKGNITRLTDFKAGSLGDPTPEQLTNLTVTEPFDGSSASLERFETGWSTLGWAGGNTPKGSDTTAGWRAVDPYSSAPNGAYYDLSLADAGAGAAAVATMAANPGISERYFSSGSTCRARGAQERAMSCTSPRRPQTPTKSSSPNGSRAAKPCSPPKRGTPSKTATPSRSPTRASRSLPGPTPAQASKRCSPPKTPPSQKATPASRPKETSPA